MPEILSRRTLNRALLARQMLIERSGSTPLDAIEQLFGLQAQEARPPYVGLWSRLAEFRRDHLNPLLHDRTVVRVTAMRGTLHLMSTRDFVGFRSSFQVMLTAGMRAIMKERLDALDCDAVVARGRAFFGGASSSFDGLRVRLAEEDPSADIRAMAYAVRNLLPLVQVPTDAPWGYPAAADFTLADDWLSRPMAEEDRREDLVIRYLRAFGPATATDAQTWFGFPLKDAFETLRPILATFRDEKKRELFDLPDAPRPPEDTPAPVRFVAEFDNLILSHADRSRVISDDNRKRIATKNLRIPGTFLVDGFVAGTWKVEAKKKDATLTIEPFGTLAKTEELALEEEGERLLRFISGDVAKFEVRFEDDHRSNYPSQT